MQQLNSTTSSDREVIGPACSSLAHKAGARLVDQGFCDMFPKPFPQRSWCVVFHHMLGFGAKLLMQMHHDAPCISAAVFTLFARRRTVLCRAGFLHREALGFGFQVLPMNVKAVKKDSMADGEGLRAGQMGGDAREGPVSAHFSMGLTPIQSGCMFRLKMIEKFLRLFARNNFSSRADT